jgi:hypothetical protein
MITKSLGYLAEEMVGQRIHMLMPGTVAEAHNSFWNKFAEVGVPKVLENSRFLFVKDKEGFVSPYKIYIKLIYHSVYEYCFVGLFRKLNNVLIDDENPQLKTRKTMQLICNNKGVILDISKQVYKQCRMTPKVLDLLHLQMLD